MESLPLALQREICSFAAAPELIPNDIEPVDSNHYAPSFATTLNEPSTSKLQCLARVCRAWRDIVATVCAEHEATRVLTLRFDPNDGSFADDRILKDLAANRKGATLLDLRIVATTEKKDMRWWDVDTIGTPFEEASDLYWTEWRAVLQQCPNLRRLDLSGLPLHDLILGYVLDAASTYCSRLEALILPKVLAGGDTSFVFNGLARALKRWHVASGGKGLRQLTGPLRSEGEREGTSDDELVTILTLCPGLEYLDGWKRSYSEQTRLVVSNESWCVSRAVWKRFCKSCVALREFSWVIVPFSDEFFLPFGQTGKPQLTRLQLTYNTRAPFRIRRNEYSTGGLNVVVAGCPALQHLDIVLHRMQPCDALIYPQIDEMIDPDVFNDDFIAAVTEHCPELRTLCIRELGSLSKCRKGSMTAASTITDRGLAALWRAPRLSCIDIHDVRCSGTAILNFLDTRHTHKQAFSTRSITFRELGVCFGEVVHQVLEEVRRKPNGERTGRTPLVISLSSRRGYVFERSWLVNMQLAFQSKFRKGELRFAVFGLKKDKDTAFHSRPRRSVEHEVIAKMLVRAWVKGDVLRIGRLVLYTDPSALDKALRQVLQRRILENTSWIVTESTYDLS